MNELKLIKYKNRLESYFEEFKKKNINILQLGCYNKEATQIFIDLLIRKKSSLTCIDTFKRDIKFIHTHDYHTFQTHFFKVIENSNKTDQINIIKMKINDGLKELLYNNKLFDIIFIDMSYDHDIILYQIISSWELLKEDGIIIFDNYECSRLENKEKCPLFAIDSFKTIYSNNILNITKNININKLNYFSIEENRNIFSKIEEQIILKKIKIIIKKSEEKIYNLFNSLLDFNIPSNEVNLPKLDLDEINWKKDCYEENEEELEREIDNNILLINKNKEFKLNVLNEMFKIYFNRKDIKNINYCILDLNYLIQTKKYNYDIFLKYIDKYSKYNNDITKILNILNIYITNTHKQIILMNDFKINNFKKKNISILNTGSFKKNTIFSNDIYTFMSNLYNKNLYHYQIYKPLNNINTINNIDDKNIYIPNNILTYEDISNLNNFIKTKIDIISYNKIFFHKKYLKDIQNINKLYLLNNFYLNLLYLTLLKQIEGGNLIFPIVHSFTDLFYQIIYVLYLHYDNTKIKFYQVGSTITNYIIIINCTNFKGPNDIILNNIKNIIINNKNDKIINSIFNSNMTKLIKKKYNNIFYFLLKLKYNLFKIKTSIVSNLSNLSYKYKYKFYNTLLQKQILYFYNVN